MEVKVNQISSFRPTKLKKVGAANFGDSLELKSARRHTEEG